jgi:hypothetical protein
MLEIPLTKLASAMLGLAGEHGVKTGKPFWRTHIEPNSTMTLAASTTYLDRAP